MDIYNFQEYSQEALKIQTKSQGLQSFKLRRIQLKYLQHLKDDFPNGIIRSICLKPRQAGWSTLIAGINFHKCVTQYSHRGLVMADKFARTNAVHSIYSTFLDNLPNQLRPMVARTNSEGILFDNPVMEDRIKKPGLFSGFLTETALDPNAGKSSSRQWAHLSEYAFYNSASEIDQSVQNSIPIAKGTAIFKESTAWGMGGVGEAFYLQWQAAVRNDYIYKPFFVPWYEIDDYSLQVPRNFILNKEELELIKVCPEITNENLAWRRAKLSEIMANADSGLSASEIFCEDFPSWPEQAFLSSGRPVFDTVKLKIDINNLLANPPQELKIKITQITLSKYPHMLKVYNMPQKGMKYSIGADVSEGLIEGDFSHAKVLDENFIEVAHFHGKLDPDEFGRVLVELAKIYNEAILVPEKNNMGHTTIVAIKDAGYRKIYMTSIQDELPEDKFKNKLGWRTTAQNKMKMLNGLIASYRDDEIKILDINTLREMISLVRGERGDVILNSKDRIVGTCLALIGFSQIFEKAKVFDPSKKERLQLENKDLFRDKVLNKKKDNL